MAQVSATVYFDAVDSADAEAKVASWVLHEGRTVSVLPMPVPVMLESGEDGTLQPVPPAPETPAPQPALKE